MTETEASAGACHERLVFPWTGVLLRDETIEDFPVRAGEHVTVEEKQNGRFRVTVPRQGATRSEWVANFEVEHGRPVGLVALVINKMKQRSGGGFSTMARGLRFDVGEGAEAEKRFWTLKLAEARSYWTEGHEDGPMADAHFNAIMAELSKIKQMIRHLQHG